MGYIYLKKRPSASFKNKNKKKGIAFLFFSFGIFLLSWAIVPILRFQIEYSIKFNQVISPLSLRFVDSGSILGESNSDLTQLSSWFVSETGQNPTSLLSNSSSMGSYQLSIPKLKIDNATVEIGSMDLKKSLIQYPQTALPGQLGSPVIFGHSVLPQFFNPKSYLTIFSTLYRLKIGDEIFIDYDSIKYRYLISEMYEVTPTDLSVLEQRFDGRYLTLITCSPPGTYLRRLIIKAQIVEI